MGREMSSDDYKFSESRVFESRRQRATIMLYEAKGGIGLRIEQKNNVIDVVMKKEFWDAFHYISNYVLHELEEEGTDKFERAMNLAEIDMEQD